MGSVYPGAIDNFDPPEETDGIIDAEETNTERDAIIKIETNISSCGYTNLIVKPNTTNPTYRIDVDIESLMVERFKLSTIDLTVDITQSGVNGLDTGTEAISTWYYTYVIYNPTTQITAGLFSISSTSPTLPSGYTKKRLVGMVYNNASGNFVDFMQIDKDYFYSETYSILAGGYSTAWAGVNYNWTVPSIIKRVRGVAYASVRGETVNNYNIDIGWKSQNIYTFLVSSLISGMGYVLDTQAFEIPNNDNNIYYLCGHTNQSLSLGVNGFLVNL